MVPFVIAGVALYLLYRHYTADAAPPPAPQNVVDLDALPSDPQPSDPTPSPAPASPTVSWQEIPEGQQLAPGADYRASAPPQNFMVMAMIPSHLASAGFTNVTIYKPGEAFPNDWPDTGDALRVEATLPPDAQPQTFNLDGVRVWRKATQQSAGAVIRHAVHVGAQLARDLPKRMPPSGNGVYAGLVRRP